MTALVTCCVADDREEAINQARQTFIFRIRRGLGMLDILAPEYHEETRYLHNLIQEGKREQAEREASEGLVTQIMNAGSADDVWNGLQKYFDRRLHARSDRSVSSWSSRYRAPDPCVGTKAHARRGNALTTGSIALWTRAAGGYICRLSRQGSPAYRLTAVPVVRDVWRWPGIHGKHHVGDPASGITCQERGGIRHVPRIAFRL